MNGKKTTQDQRLGVYCASPTARCTRSSPRFRERFASRTPPVSVGSLSESFVREVVGTPRIFFFVIVPKPLVPRPPSRGGRARGEIKTLP